MFSAEDIETIDRIISTDGNLLQYVQEQTQNATYHNSINEEWNLYATSDCYNNNNNYEPPIIESNYNGFNYCNNLNQFGNQRFTEENLLRYETFSNNEFTSNYNYYQEQYSFNMQGNVHYCDSSFHQCSSNSIQAATNNNPYKIGRKRTNLPTRKLATLEAIYQSCKYPSKSLRSSLAKKLDMPLGKVTTWFQNKRNRMLKKKACMMSPGSDGMAHSPGSPESYSKPSPSSNNSSATKVDIPFETATEFLNNIQKFLSEGLVASNNCVDAKSQEQKEINSSLIDSVQKIDDFNDCVKDTLVPNKEDSLPINLVNGTPSNSRNYYKEDTQNNSFLALQNKNELLPSFSTIKPTYSDVFASIDNKNIYKEDAQFNSQILRDILMQNKESIPSASTINSVDNLNITTFNIINEEDAQNNSFSISDILGQNKDDVSSSSVTTINSVINPAILDFSELLDAENNGVEASQPLQEVKFASVDKPAILDFSVLLDEEPILAPNYYL